MGGKSRRRTAAPAALVAVAALVLAAAPSVCLENQPTRLNRDNRRPANIAFSVPPSQ